MGLERLVAAQAELAGIDPQDYALRAGFIQAQHPDVDTVQPLKGARVIFTVGGREYSGILERVLVDREDNSAHMLVSMGNERPKLFDLASVTAIRGAEGPRGTPGP